MCLDESVQSVTVGLRDTSVQTGGTHPWRIWLESRRHALVSSMLSLTEKGRTLLSTWRYLENARTLSHDRSLESRQMKGLAEIFAGRATQHDVDDSSMHLFSPQVLEAVHLGLHTSRWTLWPIQSELLQVHGSLKRWTALILCGDNMLELECNRPVRH